jgi:hypothetical protein
MLWGRSWSVPVALDHEVSGPRNLSKELITRMAPMGAVTMSCFRRTFDVMSPRQCGEHELNLIRLWAVDMHDFALLLFVRSYVFHGGMRQQSRA